jgi:hypothetical protein
LPVSLRPSANIKVEGGEKNEITFQTIAQHFWQLTATIGFPIEVGNASGLCSPKLEPLALRIFGRSNPAKIFII